MSDEDRIVKVTVNMPKSAHRKLKAIAALKDLGLSTYIMQCVNEVTFCKDGEEVVGSKKGLMDKAIAEVEELAKM